MTFIGLNRKQTPAELADSVLSKLDEAIRKWQELIEAGQHGNNLPPKAIVLTAVRICDENTRDTPSEVRELAIGLRREFPAAASQFRWSLTEVKEKRGELAEIIRDAGIPVQEDE